MSRELDFLYTLLNTCYDRGIDAMNNGDTDSALRYLYSAAENAILIAKQTRSETSAKMIRRADDIIAFAEAIEARAERDDGLQADKGTEDDNRAESRSDERDVIGFTPIDAKNISFDDVIGLDEVKEEINRLAIYPRRHPEIYEKFKKKKSAGILLYGVPGTGKTMIANAIAGELCAAFFTVKCSDILSKWFGEAEQNVRSLFEEAAKHPISVILFDEFDALGTKRDTDSSSMKRIITRRH